ncbi:MAG: bifunctional metallophosphatase/5'-nucleotidase [Lentisphaeria bacterium]|nr:bifunctional metallophosphatase/5'-nucleotidase [Lentisphaeria bacterium]
MRSFGWKNRFLRALWILLLPILAFGAENRLRIVQTTDLHGSVDHGRLARTGTLIENEIRDAGSDRVLWIDCGDLIQGTYAMTLDRGGEAMIRFLNQFSCAVFVPGNHDFEFGSGKLLQLIRSFGGTVLASNLAWPDAPVKPWKMFRRGGMNVAVIGIAYPGLDRMFIPPVLGKVRSLDVRAQLARVMPEVMRARPDLIVLAVHSGEHGMLAPDFRLYDLIRQYPQIDLVLCGHSHQQEAGKPLGNSSWMMQAPALGAGIGVADVVYDPAKRRVVSLKTRLVRSDGVPEQPGVREMLAPLNRRAGSHGRVTAGYSPVELRPPEKTERSSALTELFGRAIAAATGADVVFYGANSRYRQKAGPLNRFQLYLLLPYADHAVTVELNAGEIRRILEEQLALQRKSGAYQAPYGLRFTTARRQLRDIVLNSTGKPLEPGRTYRCAFSSYIFSGSGRCPVLHSIVQARSAQYDLTPVRERVLEFLQKNHPAGGPQSGRPSPRQKEDHHDR